MNGKTANRPKTLDSALQRIEQLERELAWRLPQTNKTTTTTATTTAPRLEDLSVKQLQAYLHEATRMPGSGELFDDVLWPQLESGLRFSNDELTKFSRPVVEAQQFANVVRANAVTVAE